MKHTPTPWHVDISDPDADICSEFGMVAKTMGHPNNQDEEGRENARHIVHCVNSHDALLKAGDTFLEALAHVTGIEDARRAFIAALDAAERRTP